MNNHSLMLYLEEDSTSISGSGWTLLSTKNENATLIVYRTCWTRNTKKELRIEREMDWKSVLIVHFPIIMISDQIKHSHTQDRNKVLSSYSLVVIIHTRKVVDASEGEDSYSHLSLGSIVSKSYALEQYIIVKRMHCLLHRVSTSSGFPQYFFWMSLSSLSSNVAPTDSITSWWS